MPENPQGDVSPAPVCCQKSDVARRESIPKAVGILQDGSRFSVPETMSVLSILFRLKSWKNPATLVWIILPLLTASTSLFYYKGLLPKWFFWLQFIFWRLAYNVGLGLILHEQSNNGRFLTAFRRLVRQHPGVIPVLESSVVLGSADAVYRVKEYPDAFNAWMVFRVIVNVVLANDLVSYMVLSLVCCKPIDFTSLRDVVCFLVGAISIAFALWSKADAHRVIGDYAWYWGDFFFLLDKKLVFDGIFQMFPHPMYTVGYAFMYGVPLLARSYTLFYLSLFGHISQLIFLALVETPHIDRTYNIMSKRSEEDILRDEILYDENEGFLHRSELVVLRHFNPFRAEDIFLALLLLYALALTFLPAVPAWVLVAHSILWRIFLNGLLGVVLHKESGHDKWFSSHYKTRKEAFANWRTLYNTGVTMTNASYILCAFRCFSWSIPFCMTWECRVFVMILGMFLIGINLYVSFGIYEAIGNFGYFYGDFFVDDVPSRLTYNGIYRYLNNPDSSLGMSGYYGVVLMSGSPTILCLALFSHTCAKVFEILVEKPHMQQRYGNEIRNASGIEQELRRRFRKVKEEYEGRVQEMKEKLERKSFTYDKLREKLSLHGRNEMKVE